MSYHSGLSSVMSNCAHLSYSVVRHYPTTALSLTSRPLSQTSTTITPAHAHNIVERPKLQESAQQLCSYID